MSSEGAENTSAGSAHAMPAAIHKKSETTAQTYGQYLTHEKFKISEVRDNR